MEKVIQYDDHHSLKLSYQRKGSIHHVGEEASTTGLPDTAGWIHSGKRETPMNSLIGKMLALPMSLLSCSGRGIN
ncbi:MAG: hypothetical protein NC548_05970 [Lachnospiraceae bacterium]|nr:hypothetical protein [Lachnospiraceae bacterium]